MHEFTVEGADVCCSVLGRANIIQVSLFLWRNRCMSTKASGGKKNTIVTQDDYQNIWMSSRVACESTFESRDPLVKDTGEEKSSTIRRRQWRMG